MNKDLFKKRKLNSKKEVKTILMIKFFNQTPLDNYK